MPELIRCVPFDLARRDFGDDVDLFNGGISQAHSDMRARGSLVSRCCAAGNLYYDPVESIYYYHICGDAVEVDRTMMFCLFPGAGKMRESGAIKTKRWRE